MRKEIGYLIDTLKYRTLPYFMIHSQASQALGLFTLALTRESSFLLGQGVNRDLERR